MNENELIKIETKEDGSKLVSARELHNKLDVSERFSNWFDRYVTKYGFIDGQDFTSVKTFTVVNNGAKKELQDYALTLDVAKHVCMLQRSELGMKYRQYFIECEKELQQVKPKLPQTYKEALIELVAKLEENEKLQQANEQLQLENKQQEQVIKEYQPKASYYDIVLKSSGTMTISQIAKDFGLSGKALNQKLHELGVQYKQSGTWLLYSKYQDKGYTKSETYVDQTGTSRLNTKWLQTGRLFIYDLLKQNGILPLIEREDNE